MFLTFDSIIGKAKNKTISYTVRVSDIVRIEGNEVIIASDGGRRIYPIDKALLIKQLETIRKTVSVAKTGAVSLAQQVERAPDDKTLYTQTAHHDKAEDWVIFSHQGEEISLHRESWYSLEGLINAAIAAEPY